MISGNKYVTHNAVMLCKLLVWCHYYLFKKNGLVICFILCNTVSIYLFVCVGVCLQNRSLLYYFWSISQQESSLPQTEIHYTLKCTYMHMQTR